MGCPRPPFGRALRTRPGPAWCRRAPWIRGASLPGHEDRAGCALAGLEWIRSLSAGGTRCPPLRPLRRNGCKSAGPKDGREGAEALTCRRHPVTSEAGQTPRLCNFSLSSLLSPLDSGQQDREHRVIRGRGFQLNEASARSLCARSPSRDPGEGARALRLPKLPACSALLPASESVAAPPSPPGPPVRSDLTGDFLKASFSKKLERLLRKKVRLAVIRVHPGTRQSSPVRTDGALPTGENAGNGGGVWVQAAVRGASAPMQTHMEEVWSYRSSSTEEMGRGGASGSRNRKLRVDSWMGSMPRGRLSQYGCLPSDALSSQPGPAHQEAEYSRKRLLGLCRHLPWSGMCPSGCLDGS
nr:PREDICTED: uncharacterized protein LOC103557136 [Equus przewalskii]